MGGMNTLEYPLNTPPGFVRHVVALATSARHSAWCISWGEAQRQSIYSDPDYKDGYYYEVTDPATGQVTIDLKNQPKRGLAAARMAALLTYRSRDSFESRFGRRAGVTGGGNGKVPRGGVRVMGGKETTDPSVPSEKDEQKREQATAGGNSDEDDKASLREWAWREHNDGHRGGEGRRSRTGSDAGSKTRDGSASPSLGSGGPAPGTPLPQQEDKIGAGVPLGQVGNVTPGSPAQTSGKLSTGGERVPKIFSAQSYLRYQGDKVGQPHRDMRCILTECSSARDSTPTATSTLRASSTRTTCRCPRATLIQDSRRPRTSRRHFRLSCPRSTLTTRPTSSMRCTTRSVCCPPR